MLHYDKQVIAFFESSVNFQHFYFKKWHYVVFYCFLLFFRHLKEDVLILELSLKGTNLDFGLGQW